MKKTNLKPVAAALGTALAMSVAATPAAADANPFGMNDLNSGYQVAWGDKPEGKCGEGKCGEGKKADAKTQEGKCGDKKPEAKCGEGKCGEKK